MLDYQQKVSSASCTATIENTNLSNKQQVSEIMRQLLTQAQTAGQYFTNEQIQSLTRKVFFFSSRRRHTRWNCDWSSDVCSSDLNALAQSKFPDAPGTELLGSFANPPSRPGTMGKFDVVRGYTGSQIFNTTFGTTDRKSVV